MWTDTHLHLDASEYDADRLDVMARANSLNVNRFVLPAVWIKNIETVKQLAHATPGAVYCAGIHPVFVRHSLDNDIDWLSAWLQQNIDDPKLAGIGEIGLDGFIENPDLPRQTQFFDAQLRLAREFDLPVVMHVRRAQDLVLKGLRKFKPKAGIAHAFNGSQQQADQYLNLNMVLGFGGASTFTRAKQIRRLAADLPPEGLVLETDGPDIPPEWINRERNEPAHLPRIAETIAALRGVSMAELSKTTESNAQRVLPALTRA